MFEKYALKIFYNVGAKGFVTEGSDENLTVDITGDGQHINVVVTPHTEVELVQAELSIPYSYPDDVCVMPNGYQSWTETREYIRGDRQRGVVSFMKAIPFAYKFATCMGDYSFKRYPKRANFFHGYTYGYIKTAQDCTLIGSLSEREGFTILNFDLDKNVILLEKELEGKTASTPVKLFDLMVSTGTYDSVHADYFDTLSLPAPRRGRTCGYTSWYNYYTGITEDIAIRDLNALYATGANASIFQIDDGYQSFVGDWETTNEKFPHGMKYIADCIHEKGYLAGIWLAPFYIEKTSVVAREHPEWIVKTANGKPLFGMLGIRPCYTLDFYQPECAAYIRQFFNTILSVWGYDMVKLDFLYTACCIPRNGKSRGEIMCDAMDLLRDCVGEKLILGCGVPLGPAFGMVDFCRIGSDVDLVFKPRFGIGLTNREIVSVQTAIKNTIFRRGLNGRAFGCDPDVFYLRDNTKAVEGTKKSKKPLGFTWEQRLLWAKLCRSLGNIIFTSDNAGDYNDRQRAALIETYSEPTLRVIDADYIGGDVVRLHCEEDGKTFDWDINWITGENAVK